MLKKSLISALAITLLGLAACGSSQPSPAPEGSAELSASAEASSQPVDTQAEYDRALSANGLTISFIGEPFYDGTIKSEDDALKAVNSVLEDIGGDESTEFELLEIRPTETGTTYYTFGQRAGDVLVHGAAVKLVVNKDGQAIGLVGSIMPDIHLDRLENWEATQEQAEQATLKELSDNGHDGVEIIKDATEKTLIALDGNADKKRYAWVVYTDNYLANSHAGFLAHYLSAEAEYLYAIPVSEPGNADALAGDAVTFAFDEMEKGTWSGTVTTSKGETRELTVPTLTNPETGEVYLADGDRKILCADYAELEFNESIAPRIEENGRFADNELLIYDSFIRVWDFYDSIGWTGPDGEGTPSVLKMDYVDKDGNVVHNACYEGKYFGFQSFAFNREDPDGECVDIIGHEFTHCVTGTTMTSNLYFNDSGAINEGMSDVLGNLIEMMIAYDKDGAWLIGENGTETLRSMKDPHAHQQPEFTWDVYYGPAAAEATEANDCGGVHTNSSLLNSISYQLDQAGMPVEDQFYFWMNVALAMTPTTDYLQLVDLLPWCMKQAGYPQYVGALEQAIKNTALEVVEAPQTPPEGAGFVVIKLPEKLVVAAEDMRFLLEPEAGGEAIMAWVGADADELIATVPAGKYYLDVLCYEGNQAIAQYSYTEDGWTLSNDESFVGPLVEVGSGDAVQLAGDGLEA